MRSNLGVRFDVVDRCIVCGRRWTVATALVKNIAVAVMERVDRRDIPHNMCPDVHPPAIYFVNRIKPVLNTLVPTPTNSPARKVASGCFDR